ncbi:transmembrane protein 176B-like [Dunckerocampus dactyliophorus]|uniref:transmembrane protein 176B-like n=1 Tax=Dunckerocampus dactyliophorus TaxID=161453 RepID=UPI0024059CC3|nr:transmembrane protein 176B-like [Dunckerocampus dactyliophorus]
MSATMKRADGVTVLTLTSDPKSSLPPVLQILKALCYSPVCCSVSQHLSTVMGSSQSLLGAVQIVVGLLNIGLGVIPMCFGYNAWWYGDTNLFSLWMGSVFVLFGILCILSEKYPSPCLVIINVILNLSGVGFATVAVILYSINIAVIPNGMWNVCQPGYEDDWPPVSLTSMNPNEKALYKKCLDGKAMIIMVLRGINGVLLVLCVLELCLVISSSVLAIKALRSNNKRDEKSLDDPELYKALLEEVAPVSPSA